MKGGIRSVFSSHFVCCADRYISLTLYQENDGEMKHTIIHNNILPTKKVTDQYSNDVYEKVIKVIDNTSHRHRHTSHIQVINTIKDKSRGKSID